MIKKLFSLFAALTLSVGLWAIDNVAYIDADGQPKTANGVNEITNASATLEAGWYVVNGTDVQTGTLVCNGAVNIILADGAKLTATGMVDVGQMIFAPGIQVLGSNSLTIFGQTNQTGELNANGGGQTAGIGGGNEGSGSNITINGGTVIANGGQAGAGIGGGNGGSGSNITINGGTVTANGGRNAAGIGGGGNSSGSNITINGGTVTATGGSNGAGIGGGMDGSGSNIFVAKKCIVKADNNNPPTTVIAATRTATTDIASDLAGKRYVTVETPAGPVEGETFEDATSGLKFEVTATGETNTVRVIKNGLETPYSGTTYTVPATVLYNGVEFTVTTIGENAFENCTSLQSVTIAPNGVETIEGYAFSGCSSLQSVTLPNRINTIEEFAFYNCESLESITIPEGVTTIGERAFGGCFGLTSVTIEDIVCQDGINDYAFDGVGMNTPATLVLPIYWTGIRPDKDGKWYGGYFKFPAPKVGDKFVDETTKLLFEVTAVGANYTAKVISDRYRGNSYIIPDTVKYNDVDFAVTEIGAKAFSNCTSLKSITIPAGVTVIRDRAFENSGLQSITLPANVTTIEQYAFNNCSSLQSIEFPASVTTIGEYAFNNCEGLTSVTFKGETCTIGEDAFRYVGTVDELVTLVLPTNWKGTKLAEDGLWYGGYFKLETATALPTLFGDGVHDGKFLYNGQLIIRKDGKMYNAVGNSVE